MFLNVAFVIIYCFLTEGLSDEKKSMVLMNMC